MHVERSCTMKRQKDSVTAHCTHVAELAAARLVIPLDLQSKLLRILQEGEYERLGEAKTRKVDIRIIAATNKSIGELSKEKVFRRDFYYRLCSNVISVPPLRKQIQEEPAEDLDQ